MRSLSVLLVLLILCSSAMAADQKPAKDEVYGLADEFAVCGGTFYTLETIFKDAGKAPAAQSMRDQGDDYNTAGGWLLFISEKIPNPGKAIAFVQGHAMTEKARLLDQRAQATDDTKKQEIITALKAKAKSCSETYGEMKRKNVESAHRLGSAR